MKDSRFQRLGDTSSDNNHMVVKSNLSYIRTLAGGDKIAGNSGYHKALPKKSKTRGVTTG